MNLHFNRTKINTRPAYHIVCFNISSDTRIIFEHDYYNYMRAALNLEKISLSQLIINRR